MAYRNVIRSVGKSLILFFTLFLVSALMTFTFTMKDGFRQYFTLLSQQNYQDIDLVMTFDQNSNSRIISLRPIREDFSDYFNHASIFLNFYTLMDHQEGSEYVNVMSGTLQDLNDVAKIAADPITDTELIITQSFARDLGVHMGDQINLYVAGATLEYTVDQIIEDHGRFSKNVVFVNKERITLTMIGFANLYNLGNTVYLDLKPEFSVEEVIDSLKTETTYTDNLYVPTVDTDKIERQATYNASIFIGVGLLSIIALVVVMQSIFPLLYKDLTKEIAVVKTLGGSKHFVFQVWMIEFVLLMVFALPLGALTFDLIFNYGADLMGLEEQIILNPLLLTISLLSVAGFILIDVAYHFFKLERQSSPIQGQNIRFLGNRSSIITFIILTILMLVHLITQLFSRPINAIISLILAVLISFLAINLLLKVPDLIGKKRNKPSISSLISFKYLAKSKIMQNTVKIVMASFLVIGVTMMINHYVDTAINDFTEDMEVDYFLTNIFDYDADILTDVQTNEVVESVDEVVLYRDVVIKNENVDDKTMKFFLSAGYSQLNTYFDFTFDRDIQSAMEDTTELWVVLPISFKYIYQIDAGDVLTFNLSQELTQLPFKVAGFIETNYINIVFSNLAIVTTYEEVATTNSLIINTLDNQKFEPEILKEYGSRMYYFLDVNQLMNDNVDFFQEVAGYLTFIGCGVVACFMGVIFNSALMLFDQHKSDFAKLSVLGLESKRLLQHFLIEWSVITCISSLFALIIVLILVPNLGNLMLLFDNYHEFPFSWSVYGQSVLLGIPCFMVSYYVYYHRIKVHPLVDELKIY